MNEWPSKLGENIMKKYYYYEKYMSQIYDERNKTFIYSSPRRWRFLITNIYIKYNINREYLLFKVDFERKSYIKELKSWEIRN
jgi:hypothetical protein